MWRKNRPTAGQLHWRQGLRVAADQFPLCSSLDFSWIPFCVLYGSSTSGFSTAAHGSAARDALVQMDVFALSVRCYFRSAAIKVMALLSLQASRTSVTPRLAAAVLCCAAGWRPVGGNGSSSERQFHCGKKEPNRPHPCIIPAPNCSFVLCGGSADPHPTLSCKLGKCWNGTSCGDKHVCDTSLTELDKSDGCIACSHCDVSYRCR